MVQGGRREEGNEDECPGVQRTAITFHSLSEKKNTINIFPDFQFHQVSIMSNTD